LVPEVSDRVYDTFADDLDAADGLRSQMYAGARLERSNITGEYIGLSAVVGDHVALVAERLARLDSP
jgi:hypothetical protein